jgi:hypothetical protein
MSRDTKAALSNCMVASNWVIIKETGLIRTGLKKDTAEMVIMEFTKK